MPRPCLAVLLSTLLIALPAGVTAEPPPAASSLSLEDVKERLAKDGRVVLQSMNVIVERADFSSEEGKVEAIVARPIGGNDLPGLMVIPGHNRTAGDMLPQLLRFAKSGFVVMSVSQPGYGASLGPADFVGPRTFAALEKAASRLAAMPGVDPSRLGVYGYSRGALAAAQLATRTDHFRASVLGGGIYDFPSALEQVTIPAIRQNMESEAGRSEDAMRYRSPIHDLAGLDGPVLIIHGDADENAPVAQARMLDQALTALGRDHELRLVPGGTHALGMADVVIPAIAFFKEALAIAMPEANSPQTK